MHHKSCSHTLSTDVGLNHYGHIQSNNGSAAAIAGDALRPLFFALPNIMLSENFTYKDVYADNGVEGAIGQWHNWALENSIVMHLASANWSVDEEETFRNYLYDVANSVGNGGQTIAGAIAELELQHYRDPPNKVPKMRHWIAADSPNDLLAFKLRFL